MSVKNDSPKKELQQDKSGDKRSNKRTISVSVVFILVFAAIGAFILWRTLAASNSAASEAESGSISSPASVINSTNASGGKAIKYGAKTSGGKILTIPSRTDPVFCRGMVEGATYGDGHGSGTSWGWSTGHVEVANEYERCAKLAGIKYTRSGNKMTGVVLSIAPKGGDYHALASERVPAAMQGWIIGCLYGEGGTGGSTLVYDATEGIVIGAAEHAADVSALYQALGAAPLKDTASGAGTFKMTIATTDLDIIRAAAGGPPNYPNVVLRDRIPGI